MINRQNVLIDLECLLDTTIGTLYHNFPAKFAEVDFVKYSERLHNNVWKIFGVTEEEWKKAWDERSNEVLQSSSATCFAYALKAIILPTYVHGMTSPLKDRLCININIYPYILSSEETEALEDSIQEILGIEIDVTAVRIPIKSLTPSVIKDGYQALFMRDLVEWLGIHNDALSKVKIPKVTINAPAYFLEVPKDIMDSIKEEGTNPLELVTQTLAEFVRITLLKPGTFSLPPPSS